MNARRFLAGTWAIWRTGGSLRDVALDLAVGFRWMLRGWRA